jgi:UDP-glucose 4-epimerase
MDRSDMKFLVTGSSGHLGEALVRTLRDANHEVVSLDVKPSPFTTMVGSITDRECVRISMTGVHTVYRKRGLNCVVLRTSRFFPEEDDDKAKRQTYDDDNMKANEFLFRRVDLEDVVNAHLLASENASSIGFGRYIISATTPFLTEDLAELRTNAPHVLRNRIPEYEQIYQRRGWKMFEGIDRVYVNEAARNDFRWEPKYNFAHVLGHLREKTDPRSPIARIVGSKGYHSVVFDEGPYPVE